MGLFGNDRPVAPRLPTKQLFGLVMVDLTSLDDEIVEVKVRRAHSGLLVLPERARFRLMLPIDTLNAFVQMCGRIPVEIGFPPPVAPGTIPKDTFTEDELVWTRLQAPLMLRLAKPPTNKG